MLLAILVVGRPALAQQAAATRFVRIAAPTAPAVGHMPASIDEPAAGGDGPRVAVGAVAGAMVGAAVLWVLSYNLHKSTCASGTCGSDWQARGPRDSAIAGAVIGGAIGALVAWVTRPRS